MNRYPGPEDILKLLTQSMAELTHRLRHFPLDRTGHPRRPASLARLEVAAEILADSVSPLEATLLPELGRPLQRLLKGIADTPGRNFHLLEPALDHLAVALETAFAQLDQGQPAREVLGNHAWLGVAAHLAAAGTPLEIMDRLELTLQKWQETWAREDLTPALERDLHRRWRFFRELGDAMFSDAAFGPVNRQGEVRKMLVMVHSQLRREHLLQKLQARSFAAREVADAAELQQQIQEGVRVDAIFCDQVEPTNFLSSALKVKRSEGLTAPVILVCGAVLPGELPSRGTRLGADGIWPEPFTTHPLEGIFHQ